MNLLRVQDALRNASDQQLVQMMQAPDSTAPSYLVLSELRRRGEMRRQNTEEPSGTVADDLVAENQQPVGIDYFRQGSEGAGMADGYSGEEEPEQDMSEPQMFRSGGIVRMAEGGEVDLPLPPVPPDVVPPERRQGIAALARPRGGAMEERAPTLAEIYERNLGLFPDNTERMRQALREDRPDPQARRSEAANMALIEAGLRIAGSRNPSFMGAIGEGAAPAIQSYANQLNQIRGEQRQSRRDELELERQEINRRFAVGQLSAAEHRAAITELGARQRMDAQLARMGASQGASDARADARLERQLELTREERRLRGDISFEDYMAMPPERRAAFDQFRGRGRADVSGISEGMRATQQSIADIQTRLPLTPRDQRGALEEQLRQQQAFLRRLQESLVGGRGSNLTVPSVEPPAPRDEPSNRPPISSFQR